MKQLCNILCSTEMGGGGGGGELKVMFQFSLAKLICSNISGQDCGSESGTRV